MFSDADAKRTKKKLYINKVKQVFEIEGSMMMGRGVHKGTDNFFKKIFL